MRFEVAARRIQDTTFSPSTVLTLPLPKDGIYRALNLEFHGSIVTTFSSGSPAAPAESTIDSLVTLITVTVNGRLVKSVRPHMLHLHEILAWGQEGRRTASAAASAVTGDLPTTDGGFVWGTTTQTSTVRETLRIPFEMELARIGKEKTWLNLNGVSTAEVKFTTAAYSGLDTTGATVVYTASTFLFEAYMEEVIGFTPNTPFFDYQQVLGTDAVAAQQNNRNYDLTTGQLLAGLLIYVKNGASPSVAADLGLTRMSVITGNKTIKLVDFTAEQDKMRQTYRCNSARASGKSRLDGVCYISLLTNDRDLNTAFDARGLNSLKFNYDTHASATYGLTVNIEQHVIVSPQGR